jgi:hypothetical protein
MEGDREMAGHRQRGDLKSFLSFSQNKEKSGSGNTLNQYVLMISGQLNLSLSLLFFV